MPGPAKDTSPASGVSPEQLRRQRFDAHMAEVAPEVARQWRVKGDEHRVTSEWYPGPGPHPDEMLIGFETRSLCVLSQTLRNELYERLAVADLLTERDVPTGSTVREYTLAERVLIFAGQEPAAADRADDKNCPVCGGNCAGANPPVYNCPMLHVPVSDNGVSNAAFVAYLYAWTRHQPDDALPADSKELARLIALARRGTTGAASGDDGGSSPAPQPAAVVGSHPDILGPVVTSIDVIDEAGPIPLEKWVRTLEEQLEWGGPCGDEIIEMRAEMLDLMMSRATAPQPSRAAPAEDVPRRTSLAKSIFERLQAAGLLNEGLLDWASTECDADFFALADEILAALAAMPDRRRVGMLEAAEMLDQWNEQHQSSSFAHDAISFNASAIRAAADAAPGETGDGWQPIKTAPKDGTPFIAFGPAGLHITSWKQVDGGGHPENGPPLYWWVSDSHEYIDGPHDAPTHWRPLPPAPESRP